MVFKTISGLRMLFNQGMIAFHISAKNIANLKIV